MKEISWKHVAGVVLIVVITNYVMNHFVPASVKAVIT
jgi:hypothetical protein